jgi:hypothetical protein
MNESSGPQTPATLGYHELRTIVGVLGVLLPFVLAIGFMLKHGFAFEQSISAYYYTYMRNVFVGSLCAIGLFLVSTRGYDLRDEIAGKLACIFAVIVALCPTTPACCPAKWQKIVGTVHLTSAALLFSTLAYFCLKLFVISKQPAGPSPEKLRRNKVYKVCGWAIVGCIVGITVFKFFLATSPEPVLSAYPPMVFSAESIAIWAFGIAWLIKGELFLKDKATPRSPSPSSAQKH